ncbi:MAG: ABC transporter permease [Actinobacteria bacterium]|nr:ABC transporter permease [Actinomycetota bacterium]
MSSSELQIEHRPAAKPWSRSAEAVGPYSGVLAILLLLCVFFTITQPKFATTGNLLTILEANASLIVVSVGLTFVMIVGGFDLSIGGVSALAGVLLGKLVLAAGVADAIAIPLIIVGAAAFGALVNGGLIARVGLSFLVVTLGTMALTRGLALLVSGGSTQSLYDHEVIRWLGSGQVLGSIPVPALIAVAVLLVAIYVTRYTGYGRLVYAVGGNDEASRLAGVNVALIRMSTYSICAALAGLAGILDAGRLASASPDAAVGLELSAAAAVLLGGTALGGGVGTMLGTLLGALFLGVLSNGLIIASISVYWQGVVTGCVLILSLLADRLRRRRLATSGQ